MFPKGEVKSPLFFANHECGEPRVQIIQEQRNMMLFICQIYSNAIQYYMYIGHILKETSQSLPTYR